MSRTRAALFGLAVLMAVTSGSAGEPKEKPAEKPASGRSKPSKPIVHPAVADRVVIVHDLPNATHVVATTRPKDLRSKEILVGDGVKVTNVSEFFKTSKVRLAAIPVGTTGVVLDTVDPWQAGNELRAVKVGITSGPLDGQEWWISVPGVAARGTPEGERKIERWRTEVRAGRLKDPRFVQAYVSPEPPPRR